MQRKIVFTNPGRPAFKSPFANLRPVAKNPLTRNESAKVLRWARGAKKMGESRHSNMRGFHLGKATAYAKVASELGRANLKRTRRKTSTWQSHARLHDYSPGGRNLPPTYVEANPGRRRSKKASSKKQRRAANKARHRKMHRRRRSR